MEMILSKDYQNYQVPVDLNGSASFFNQNEFINWDFFNYLTETHNSLNKFKKFKQIKLDYISDLNQLLGLNPPEEVQKYVNFLKNKKFPKKSDLKAILRKPKIRKRYNYERSTIFKNANHCTITINNNVYDN